MQPSTDRVEVGAHQIAAQRGDEGGGWGREDETRPSDKCWCCRSWNWRWRVLIWGELPALGATSEGANCVPSDGAAGTMQLGSHRLETANGSCRGQGALCEEVMAPTMAAGAAKGAVETGLGGEVSVWGSADPEGVAQPCSSDAIGLHRCTPRWQGVGAIVGLGERNSWCGMEGGVQVIKRPCRVDHQLAFTVQERVATEGVWEGELQGLGIGRAGCREGVTLCLELGGKMRPAGVMGSRHIGFLEGASSCGGSKGEPDAVDPGGSGGVASSSTKSCGHIVSDAPKEACGRYLEVQRQLDCSILPNPLRSVGGARVTLNAGGQCGEGPQLVRNNGAPSQAAKAGLCA